MANAHLITAADTPADYVLNALVKLVADGKSDRARAAVAKADECLFDKAVDRDLFRAIRRAVEFSADPGPLEIKFLIDNDEDGTAPADEVVERLCSAVKQSPLIEWQTHLESSIRQLQADHNIRQARDLGRELVAATSRPTPERCDDIIRTVRKIQDGLSGANRTGAATLIDIVDRWKANKCEKLIATGFGPVDRALGGGLPVGLHGIAASPGVGKSALGLQLAAGVLLANRDARVVWFRGEMTNDILFSKMLACWSQLRGDALDQITLRDALHRAPESRAAYLDMIDVIGDRLVVVDPPLTPATIERWIDEARPDLAIVDYLQLVESTGFKDRRADLDHAVRRIANASTRAEIPIVVVSAVAKGTSESSEIGTITKESNQLDFEAHTYWSLWTQGDRHARPRRVLLRINKSRSGSTSDEELWFHGASQYYEAAAAPEYEEFGGFAPR